MTGALLMAWDMAPGKLASTELGSNRGMTQRICSAVLLAAVTLAATIGPGRPAAAAETKKDKGSFVTIDTLTATVLAANGRRQTMTVQSGVDVGDDKLRAYAVQVTPRLRDAFAQELQLYAGGMASGAPPDADYVARRLQAATDRVLGKPGARFLIGGIMVN
jgi:hypothetical protein